MIKFRGITHIVRLAKHLIKINAPKRAIFYTLSSISDAYLKNHDKTRARLISNIATRFVHSSTELSICTRQNVAVPLLARFVRPFSGLELGFGEGFIRRNGDVGLWVALVRLYARLGHTPILKKERDKLNERGWYSCWLKSVISLALAREAESAEEKRKYFDQAVQDITVDTEPFSGSPRATDLHEIRELLENSFYEFLLLAPTPCDFENALKALKKVSDDTAATLFRSDSGPLPYHLFLNLLLRYIKNKNHFSEQATKFIFEIISTSEEHYRAYEQHAEYYSYLAIALASIGKVSEAAEELKNAATLLTSYGYHKDINLFDLIDSISAFSSDKEHAAKYSLEVLKPLIDAALYHSDERSTKHLYNSWVNAIADFNLPYCFYFLHKNIIKNAHILNWMASEALYDLLKKSKGIAHPLLSLSLYSILDHTSNEEERSSNNEIFTSSINELATHYGDIYINITRDKVVPCPPKNTSTTSSNALSNRSFKESIKNISQTPILFPPNAKHSEIIATIQKISKRWNDDAKTQEYLVTYLSYKLEDYCTSALTDDAVEIIYFLARKTTFYDSGKHPLYTLGEALESAELKDLAIHAYVLSFIYSRGRGGWMPIGDTRHGASLLSAHSLDPELTEKIFAQEIAHRISNLGYTGEIVKSVIIHLGLLLGADAAFNAWSAAFEVEQGRLSLPPSSSSFENINFEEFPNLCLDEAIVLIILTLLSEPDLRLKNLALFWLARIIRFTPTTFAVAFNIWISECNITSSIIALLDLLNNSDLDTSIKKTLAINYDNIVRKKLFCATKTLDAICRSNSIQISNSTSDKSFNLNAVQHFEPSNGFRLMLEMAIKIGMPAESLEIVRKIYQSNFTEQAEEIMQACYKMFGGRDFDSIPKSPVLLYEHELLFEALNLAFSTPHITHALTSDEALINKLTPDIVGHLHIEASSEVRPPYPETIHFSDGAFRLQPIIASVDEQFLGWIQLAFAEAHYFTESGGHFKRVILAGTLSQGAANTRPSQTLPFYHIDDSRMCWDSEKLYSVQKNTTRSGILVGLATINDWLGHDLLLIPPTHIFRPNLSFPKLGEPLIWQDERGAAFSMKRWRTHKNGYTGAHPIDITGAELLARPDIVERLQIYYGQNMQLHQIARNISVEENEVYPFKNLLK